MKFTLAVLCIIISQIANAQKDWELLKERNGVKVYMRDYANSGIKELKCTSQFRNISLNTIAAAFKDVDNTSQWAKELKKSLTLKTISETERIEYYEVKIPWPLKNRDVIYYVKLVQDPKDRSLNVVAKSVPQYIPPQKGIVRVIDSFGSWKFTPKEKGILEVEYYLYANPIGFPAWLVNIFSTDSPINVILTLKEFLSKPEYKNKKFNFIKE